MRVVALAVLVHVVVGLRSILRVNLLELTNGRERPRPLLCATLTEKERRAEASRELSAQLL